MANFNQTWHMGKGIQVLSNKGPSPFPRGENNDIVKTISFDRIQNPSSPELYHRYGKSELRKCVY